MAADTGRDASVPGDREEELVSKSRLLLAIALAGSLWGSAADADLLLSPVPGSPFPTGEFPQDVAITADGAFLYTVNATPNNVSGFAIRADGSLVPVPGSPFSAGTNPQELDTDSARVYVAEGTGANAVRVYDRQANGALAEIAGSPFPSGGISQHVDVAPSETFLATGNVLDTVSVLSIAANGALAPITGSPFADGDEPQELVIRSDSGRLFVTNCVGGTVSVFGLAGDGTPTAVTGSPFSAGNCPNQIDVVPGGDVIYVGTFDGVYGFSVAADGTLTGLPGNPVIAEVGAVPQGLAVSRDGSRLFVGWRRSVADEAELRVFAVQPGGGLVEEAFSRLPILPNPGAVAVHPDGMHVYVTDLLDSSVAGYELVETAAVPVVSPRALALLAVLLMGAGALFLRRRRVADRGSS
jgi:6-phosphogluconolactonase